MADRRKVPKVRLCKPNGRQWQVRYDCPAQKREIRLSTNTHDEAEALEFKKGIEAKLQLGIEIAPRRKMALGPDMPWSDFREEYTRLKVSTMRSAHSSASAEYRLDVAEAIMSPRTIGELSKAANLATLQARLLAGDGSKQKKARAPHTVKSYMGSIIAALNWAHRPMHWLPDAIEFDVLEVDDPDKGRPLCAEEFERMLAAVPKAIGTEDAIAVESWRHLLRGLWESGLRLGEALAMHWDQDGAIVPHNSRGGLVLLHIPAKLQKSRKAQDVPTTPAFTALIGTSGKGWIFNPIARRGKQRLTVGQVGRIISNIGELANIVVSASGKTASAHDLRRSFGQRMADAGLPPRDLQAIMRHASFTTTEAYYLRDKAHDQGQRIAAYLGTVTKKPAEQKAEPVFVSR